MGKNFKQICKINFLVLCVLLGSVSLLSAKPSKEQPSIQDKFNSITPAQREAFNIKVTFWTNTVPDNPSIPGDQSFPGFANLVFCHACEEAIYDGGGNLVNSSELSKIPTSSFLKVPENWNQRLIVVVPPGSVNHVEGAAAGGYGWLNPLLKEGFAVAAMNNPLPGYPGFPYDLFIGPPFSTNDFSIEYFATGHMFKGLMAEIFAMPIGIYGHSRSRGTVYGMGLLLSEAGNPFDGFVITSGATPLDHLMSHIEAFGSDPQRVPLINLPPIASEDTAAEQVTRIVVLLEAADPEYRAFILSAVNPDGSPDIDERLTRALAYNIDERPGEVQRAWADLEFGLDLKKPTIYFQGLRDRQAFPAGALAFSQNVVDAERSDLLRLYLIKNLTHGHPVLDPPIWPLSLPIDALHALDAWVQNDTEPAGLNAGSFNANAPNPVQSCTTRGFGTNPMGCFCAEMGGVDFNGQAIPGCN